MCIRDRALTGQSETITTKTAKKNSITASTFLGQTAGIALDYRRDAYKNREFVFGVRTSYQGVSSLNVGFRKYYRTQEKLSFGFGFDAGLKRRNIIGDNLVSRTIENTVPKLNYGEIKFVTGAYYKLDDRFELMTEVQLRPYLPFLANTNHRRIKLGLKYNF